jgi:hypothetical protein
MPPSTKMVISKFSLNKGFELLMDKAFTSTNFLYKQEALDFLSSAGNKQHPK